MALVTAAVVVGAAVLDVDVAEDPTVEPDDPQAAPASITAATVSPRQPLDIRCRACPCSTTSSTSRP
ncbi:MAG TPA: hypothetical protein VNF50_01555 [Acidimicrobiales bacterium]|nr:hypothetical protein [Acidimicrobiales bacterium]